MDQVGRSRRIFHVPSVQMQSQEMLFSCLLLMSMGISILRPTKLLWQSECFCSTAIDRVLIVDNKWKIAGGALVARGLAVEHPE